MTVSAAQIQKAAAKGLINVDGLATACDKLHFPFYMACTILAKETSGRNIYGHDVGGIFTQSGNLEVTETNYKEFLRRLDGGERSNGVGPMQLTYRGYHIGPQSLTARGFKAWIPTSNIAYGVEILSRSLKANASHGSRAFWYVAKAYNGNSSYADDAVARAKTWLAAVGDDDTKASPPPPPPPPHIGRSPTAQEPEESHPPIGGDFAMPTSPSNGYHWRGVRACQCVIDATADYEKRAGSKLTGYIYQGSYSNSVNASAGTHSKGGALDTVKLTDRGVKIASSIGFWPSDRTKAQGFVPHAHWVVLGCPHASSSLKAQMSELRRGGDGLVGNRADVHRSLRPKPSYTYREWKGRQARPGYMRIGKKWFKKIPTVTVSGVNRARTGGWVSRYVWFVQAWLRHVGYYKNPLDGKWGGSTQAALNNFRRDFGFTGKDATGAIGINSLRLLHNLAKSKKPISDK